MQRAGAEAERFGSRVASSRALNLKLDSLTGWAGLLLRNIWGMETQAHNINVIRSVWRRIKKPINVRDLQPVKDVKGGGGVTGKSKPSTGGTGTTGSH